MTFESLGLAAPLLEAIKAQHYEEPYPIQLAAIPPLLEGRDLLGIAQTGSGKTASFVLPILQKLDGKPPASNRHIKALVMVPTRELAAQVHEVFQTFGSGLPRRIKTVAVYGGVSINPQMMQLQGAQIVVATPGRLIDLMYANALHLDELEVLVLDEADKMLNLGFKEEMDMVFARLPRRRQNMLFSATVDAEVQVIIDRLLHDPVTVKIEGENKVPDLIQQLAYHTLPERKGPLLRYLIRQSDWKQVLVFASSVRTVDNVTEKLNKNGIQAAALHSQKSQGGRTEVLRRFKSGELRVLVATDLAARGIDVQSLPCVINYELPRSPLDYVHRIGRTGRAESAGVGIALVGPEDLHHFRVIQKKMGKRVPLIYTDDVDLQGV